MFLLSGQDQIKISLPFIGVVIQINPVKTYRRQTWVNGKKSSVEEIKFFAKVSQLQTNTEMFCMFDDAHDGKFSVGDIIGFEASFETNQGNTWYRILQAHRVENLGKNQSKRMTKEFDIRYIGRPKLRDGVFCASALVGNSWSVTIPVSVMRAFFSLPHVSSSEQQSRVVRPIGPGLYAIIEAPADASESEIKKAYRQMARRYHPDVCDLPDAAERFRKIQEAYESLGDPVKRQRHDALLQMSGKQLLSGGASSWQSVGVSKRNKDDDNGANTDDDAYIPPHRCGVIQATVEMMGTQARFEKIESWIVQTKKVVKVIPLSHVGFFDGYIEVTNPDNVFCSGNYGCGSVSIEASRLPFVPKKKMSGKKHSFDGFVTVTFLEQVNARWKPGIGDIGEPVIYWDTVDVSDVRLDKQALESIRILGA